MGKKFYLSIFLLISALWGNAQNSEEPRPADSVKYWKLDGISSVNLSQSSYSNWNAGGVNSIAGTAIFNVFYNYKKKNRFWDNRLETNFGLRNEESRGILKTDDKLLIESKMGRRANFGKHWFYSGAVSFNTQFAPGKSADDDSTIISRFLAPGYLMVNLGLDYKPNDRFSISISPLTQRTTFVYDQNLADAGNFGVEGAIYDDLGVVITPGKNVRHETGGFVRVEYRGPIVKNVKLQSKLSLFSNYLENPQNVDVYFENLLTFKVNKYISTSLILNMIYDDDINFEIDSNGDGNIDERGPRLQFKQVLGLGLSYTFSNHEED